jgi:4-hydroxy-tetrahydrodipicolinate synthase
LDSKDGFSNPGEAKTLLNATGQETAANSQEAVTRQRGTPGGRELGGVLAVFQTPFGEGSRIDHQTMQAQFDWLFANGADGVVFGMVSEVLRLSSEERDEVATLACSLARGRGQSVVSVGAESIETAVRHARHAESAGADAVMATPPALHAVGEDALYQYYAAIAGSVSIPLIVQDASSYVGASLPITLQARLHSELGDRVMFKPEAVPVGPRLTRLLDATGGKARVFEGTGGLYLIDSFRRGAIGTMPAGDLIWAQTALWRALQAGDFAYAYRIAGPLAQIVSLQTNLDSFIAIEKYLLARQGIFPSTALRRPVGEVLDAQGRAEIDRLVDLLRTAVDDH